VKYFLVVLLSLGAASPGTAGQSEKEPSEASFQVDVNLVNLLVTVKDARGAPVADLEKEDFTVLDGGGERDVAVFERRTNRPLSVALMLDTSLSTAKEFRFERESGKRFLKSLLGRGAHEDDRVAILQFSDSVEMLTGFTDSSKRINKAMKLLEQGGGTSMYDAILLTSRQLKRRTGRRVMVIITDGGDTTSYMSYQDAQKAAQDIDAVIYGIIVIPIRADAGRNIGGENALKTLAANTGGETFVQYADENLDEAFDEILESLRTQYLIAYYPPERTSDEERFRRVEVNVARSGARVFSRNGYYLSKRPRKPPTTPPRISVRPKPRPKTATHAHPEPKP
jgi:Ca-activated chloride channel family protein